MRCTTVPPNIVWTEALASYHTRSRGQKLTFFSGNLLQSTARWAIMIAKSACLPREARKTPMHKRKKKVRNNVYITEKARRGF